MKGRLLNIFIANSLACLPFLCFSQIYVAINGNDSNIGTIDKPKATIQSAIRQVRELRRLHDPLTNNDIRIIVKGGTYFLEEPIFIRPEDAGTSNSRTKIVAAPNETPVLSGGFRISNWQQTNNKTLELPITARSKVWVADIPRIGGENAAFRQLWINEQKAIRAKDNNGNQMSRILSWNKKEQTCWIPTPKINLAEASGMEMFIHQWWAIAILRIKSFEVHGDSTKLSFYQPESRIQSEHPWPSPWISKETGNSAFYLTNAIQMLDEPGEWYLDESQHKLYYWPRKGENLLRATVIAPQLENLVKMQGTIDHPISHINFSGISFAHTGWLRPSLLGHVPHQTGMYMLDAYRLKIPGTADKAGLENQAWVGRPAAAIEVSYADSTHFDHCNFTHLASTGLDYHKGVHDNIIKGNLFKDIGGSAILAGVFSDEASEIHLPYNPVDEREVCTGIQISNNLITNVTNEDWSCVGIGAGYTRNTLITHNEIEDVSYSGITMGWGWSPTANAMRNNQIIGNKIHHFGKHNYDCAGIYTLSAQANSLISENYVDSIIKAPYSHLPSHWFYLYTDEGSDHFTVRDNWTPTPKYLQNANGPTNVWSNNGPQVNNVVRLNAGLQADFQYLWRHKSTDLAQYPINKEHPEIIELIVKDGTSIDLQKLRLLLHQNSMDSNAIYHWQNHYVIFDKVKDITVMQGRLQNNFPSAEVKVYHDLFYEFNRKYCADKKNAKDWDHILLTANLVDNKAMQAEYLNYHATQFEKWPELAQGFCNADFQQLLIFRNGRQLVLVISIPKGESLNHLNPRTTENNPRVDEWNRIMKKYQEGIAGTKKGETWVFLNQLGH